MAQGLERSLASVAVSGDTEDDFDLRNYSPLSLAYIGDAVYELMVRRLVMEHGSCSVNKMHKITSSYVMASSQSELIRLIKEELTKEELTVYKRGRNAKSGSIAKHQSMSDYRRATGFEALVGYLYLKEEYARLDELVSLGIARLFESRRA